MRTTSLATAAGLLGLAFLASCSANTQKQQSQAPSMVAKAAAPPPAAGGGSKEAFDGPPEIPTFIPPTPWVPSGVPTFPTMPGVPGTPGVPGVPGGAFEGLDFKVPPCPPAPNMAIGTAVQGTLYMPKGDMALGGAKVTLTNALGVDQGTTYSDGCGRFVIGGVVPGLYKVKFAVRTFKGEQSVNVPATGVSMDFRVDIKFLQVAVFQGSWDHVEKILDKVGVPYTLLPNAKLETTDLSKFNIVFINCNETSESTVSSTVKEKLKSFVGGGGALYVSDRALPYILATWPGQVSAAKEWGNAGTRKHSIFDIQLGSYLRGALQVPIIYDLGGWRRLEKIQPATTLPLLRDAQTQEPAIITFAYNGGFVGYTTYHQGAQMNDAMTFSLVFFVTRL
jgi:hypothetical protein